MHEVQVITRCLLASHIFPNVLRRMSSKPVLVDQSVQVSIPTPNSSKGNHLEFERSLEFAQDMMSSTQSTIKESRTLLCNALRNSSRREFDTLQTGLAMPVKKWSSFTQTAQMVCSNTLTLLFLLSKFRLQLLPK